MMKFPLKYFLIFLFFTSLFSEVYFIPPKNWKCVDPKSLNKEVCIGFIKKGKGSFNPSINLAYEKSSLTLDEYIQLIKEDNKDDLNSDLRVLGRSKTSSGIDAQILEITKRTPMGTIMILQFICKLEEKIFVITSALAKDEISLYKDEILKSFKSLRSCSDLFSEIKDTQKKEILEKKIQNKEKDLEKFLEQEFEELGFYWKTLVLQKYLTENKCQK